MIRFNYKNIHGQCPYCNVYNNGNYENYHVRLPKRIGQEEYDKLQKVAEIALRVPYTFTKHELKEIIKDALLKLRELKVENKKNKK